MSVLPEIWKVPFWPFRHPYIISVKLSIWEFRKAARRFDLDLAPRSKNKEFEHLAYDLQGSWNRNFGLSRGEPWILLQTRFLCCFVVKLSIFEIFQMTSLMASWALTSAQIGFISYVWPRNTLFGKIGKSQFSSIFQDFWWVGAHKIWCSRGDFCRLSANFLITTVRANFCSWIRIRS